jgi:hypothetical protein
MKLPSRAETTSKTIKNSVPFSLPNAPILDLSDQETVVSHPLNQRSGVIRMFYKRMYIRHI